MTTPMTTKSEAVRWPIHWVPLQFSFRRRAVMWAICSKTRRFIRPKSHPLELWMVHDLLVGAQGCEEGRRCLNTDCPLNTTTPASLIRETTGGRRVPRWLTDIKPMPMDADLQAFIDQTCDRNPEQGIVMFPTRTRKRS